ncbi:MAG: Na+/H+ antiporter subunit E [Magnetococcus sp. THC-1_WYH]
MRKFGNQTALFVTLFLFWVLINGSLSLGTLLVGGVVSLAIAAMLPGGWDPLREFHATPAGFSAAYHFLIYFIKELIRSNIRMAGVVLSPRLPINPGIVKVHTKLKSKMGRLLLANSITLTPGTLTVMLEGEWLYVHWVTVESTDIEAATAHIVAGFEKYLEVMYG